MTIQRMTMNAYLEAEGISASGLNLIHRSPAHFKADQENPKEPTAAMLFGTLFHTLALEPDLFPVEFGLLPAGLDRRTKEGRELWADWQIENAGKQAVSQEDYDKAQAMVASLRRHTKATNAIDGGQPERSVFFFQEVSSLGPIACKARFDYITESGIIVDLKTTTDARPEPFARDCFSYGYHRKSAFYLDAYKTEFGKEAAGFLFIAVEKEPPYAVSTFLADETFTDQGRDEYRIDLNTYAECIASGIWPSYPDEVLAIMLPGWARKDEYTNE
jgi:exodeoxyribonuclease VIII